MLLIVSKQTVQYVIFVTAYTSMGNGLFIVQCC